MRSWSSELDRVEVLEDLLAQRRLGRLVALARRVEAQLEQPHQLLGDARVGRDHVVLVALGEARADPLAVLAVGAQDRDLAPVEAGRDHQPVERVRLGLAAPDGRDAVGDPLAGLVEVERAVGRARARRTPAPTSRRRRRQARRELLDHPQPEVLEHRRRAAELELAADAVQPDARVSSPSLRSPTRNGLPAVNRRSKAGDVLRGRRRVDRRLVVLGQPLAPSARRAPARARRRGATSASRARSSQVRVSRETSRWSAGRRQLARGRLGPRGR